MEIRNLQRKEGIDRALVRRAAGAALKAAGREEAEVSFVFVGDRSMARLNQRYTGREGSTDVLAFPLDEGSYLGEVIVSAAACRRQAGEAGHSFARELALLVVHGVLHLAGYDHVGGAEEARRMRRQEAAVLRGLGIPA